MAFIYGVASFLLIISGATRSVAIMPSPTNPNPCCDGTGPKSPNAPLLPVGQGAPVIDVPNGYDFGGPPLPPPNFLQMRPPLLPFVGRDISARSPPSGSGVAITFGPSSVGTGKSPGGPKSNGQDKGYSVIDDAKSAPAGRRSINSRVLLQGGSGSRMMRERGPPSGANDKKNLICVNGLGPGCGAPVINGDSSSGKGKKIDDKGKLPDIGASGGKGNDPSNFCINGLGPGCGVEVIDGNTGIPSGGKSGQNGIMDKNAAASDKKGTASKPGPTSNKNGFGPGPDMGGIDLGPDMGGMGPGPNMGDMSSGPDVGGMGPGPDMGGMGPGPDMGGMEPGPDMGGMGPGPDMGGMGSGPDMSGLGPGPDMGGMGPGLDMGGKGSGPDMSGMGPGPGMGGMGPGPDMGGMGPGPDMGGMGPGPDMGGMGPGPDMGSKGSGPDMGGMGPGPAMGGMGPGPDMGGMGPGPDMGGMGPGPDMGGMGPGPDMGGKGSGLDMGGMGPGPDMGGMGPGPDMGGMGPGPDMGGMGPGPDMGGMGPGPDMGGKGSGPDMGGMGPGPDMGGMGPGPDMGGMGPGQDMGGMGPIPGMGGMGPGPDMGGMGPGPDMGGMGPGPDMGGMGPGSDIGGMGPGPDISVMGPGPGMGGMGPGPDISGMEPAPDMGSMGPGPDMGGMGLGPEIGGMGPGPDMGGMGPGPNNGGTGPGPDVGGMGPGPDMGGMGSGPDMGGIGQGPDMGGVGPGAGMGGMGLGPSGSSSGAIGTAGIGLGGQMGIEVEIKSPEIEPRQAPEVKMPEIEMKQRPEIKTPEIKIPEINTPEIKTPEIEPIQAIEIKVPEIEPQQGPEIEGPGFLPGSVGVPMANGVGAGMQINGVSNVPGPSIDGGMSIDSGTLGMQANGVPDALAGGGLPVDSGSVGFKINGGPNVQVPSKGVSVQMQSIGTGVLLNGGGGPSDNQYGGMVVGNGGMGFQINGGSDVPGASVGGVNGNGGVANNLQQMNGNINNQGSKSGMSGSSGASLPIFGSPVDTGSGGYNKMMSGSVDPPGFLANGLDKPSDGNLGMLSPNKMNKPPSWLTDGFGDGSSGSGGSGGMDGGSGGSTGDNQIKVSTGKVDGNKGSSSINIEVKKDAEVTLNIDQGGSKCVCPPQITSTASPQMIKAGASIAKMSNKNVLIAKIPTAKLGGNTMFPNVEIPNLVIEPVSDNSYSSSSPGMTSSEFSLDSSGASSDVLVVAALPGDLGTSGKVNVKVATDPMTGNLVIETTPSPMTGKGLGSSGAGSSSQGSSLGSVGCINGMGPNCGVPIVDGSTTGSGNDKVDDSGKSFGIDLGMSLGDVGSSIIDSSSSISSGAAGPVSNVGGQSASLGGTGPVVGPGDAGGPDLSAGGPDLSAGGPAPGKSVEGPSSDASFGVPAPALAAAGLIPGQGAGGPATGKSAGAGPGKNVGGPEPGTSPVGAGPGTGPGVLGSSIDLGAMGPSLGGLGPSIDLGVIEPGSSVSGLGPAVPDGISSGALGTMDGNLGMPSVIGLDGTGLSLDIGSSPGVGGFDPSVGTSGTGSAAVAAGAGLVVDGTGFVIKKSDEDENKKLKVKCINGIGPDCVGITGGSSAGNVDSSVSVGGSGGITLAGVGEVKGMVDLASVGVDAGLNVGIGVADGSKIGDGLSGVDLNVDLGKVSGCVNGLGPGCGVPIIQGDTGAPVSVSVGGSSGPDAGIGGIVAKIKKEEDGDKSGKISLVFASGNASAIDNMLSSTSLGLGMQQQTSIINAADPSIQQPSIGSSADLLSPLSEPGKSDLTILSKPSTSKSKGSELLKKEEDGDGSGTSSSKGVLCINGLGPGCGVPIVSGSGDTLSSQPGSSLSGTGAQSPAPVPGGQAPSAPGSADPGLMAPSKSQGLPADILGLLGGGPSLPGITGPSSSSGGAGTDTSSGGPGTSGPSIGGSMGGGPAPSSSAGGVGSGTSAGAPGSGSKASAPGSGGSSSKSPGTKGKSSASVSSSSPTSGGSPKPKTSSGSPGVSPLATALSKPAPKAKKPNLAALCLLYLGAFIDGVGYAPYPGDCQKLVQCLYYNGKLNAVARECPMGMFWDQPLLLCRLPGDVPCFDDRCLVPGVLKYSRSGGCNSYFKCIEGISVPACCPKGYKYDEDEECKPVSGIADDVCDDDCDTPGDLDTLTSSSCPSMPDSENKYGYIVREFGGLRFRGCPDGTMYSSQLCRCQGNLNEPISSKYRKTCSPEFKMNFDDGFRDISDGGLSFEYNNIFRSNKACKFNGDGQIFIWGFTSRYLGKSFAIKLKVKPAKGAARRRPETIISNCGSHGEPSIEISIYKGRMRFKAKTTGSTKVVTASEMYKEDDWNEVTYYYNGKHFGGSCGKNTFTKIMGGNLEPRDNPLSIGSCGRSSFRGKIDDLEIFTACVPPDV